MAGVLLQPQFNYGAPPPPKQPSIFDVYSGAVKQTGTDYDSIMKNYNTIFSDLKNGQTNLPLQFTPTSPQQQTFTPYARPKTYDPVTQSYTESADTSSALSALKDLTQTGGYSSQDVSDIRARGISPIRSVYANAQQDMDRQRVLQGGYSPGYAAATAKMARELSDKISAQVTNINAGLAERIAQNKLSIAPSYASSASQEANRAAEVAAQNAAAKNTANQSNTSEVNRINQANTQGQNATNAANLKAMNDFIQQNAAMKLQVDQLNRQLVGDNQKQQLSTVDAMRSLYGTTPALASTFGNQALAANAQNTGILQNNAAKPNPQGGLLNFIMAGAGGR